MTPAPLVDVDGLQVRFGAVHAVAGVSLSVGVAALLLVPAVARLHRAFRANGRLAVRSVVAATVSGA